MQLSRSSSSTKHVDSYYVPNIVGKTNVTQLGVPVHEYWLEHKRAMMAELSIQREEMFQELQHSQQSALLGIDLVKWKLEKSLEDSKTQAKELVKGLHKRESAAMEQVRKREIALFKLQQDFNVQMEKVVGDIKQAQYERVQQEQELAERKKELENWAESIQRQFMVREKEMAVTARNIDRDMALLYAMKKKDEKHHRGESVLGSNKHVTNFARITHETTEIPRVVSGEPFHFTATLDSPVPLTGTPVTITYLDGKEGTLSGDIVSVVEESGTIQFQNLRLSGPRGTSHTLLVSMPRVAAGTIVPLEISVNLLSPPDIVASGHWNVTDLKLRGIVRVRGVEPFGLLGVGAKVSFRHESGRHDTIDVFGNESNEFGFEFDLKNIGFINWAEIAQGQTQIETDVPVTKYTNSFIHQFEVKVHSDSYPTFQYPHRAPTDCVNVNMLPIEIPHTDLCTEIHLSDNGSLMASANVAFQVTIYAFKETKWVVRRVIQHDSFVSQVTWSPGGRFLGLYEPKNNCVSIWSVTDLVKSGDKATPAEATYTFTVPLNTANIVPIDEGNTISLLLTVNNTIYRIPFTQRSATRIEEVETVFERPSHEITAFAHGQHPRAGAVLFVGLATGDLIVVCMTTKKQLFHSRMAMKERIVKINMLEHHAAMIVTPNSISTLVMKPAWGVTACPFRPPSPIQTALPSSHFSDNNWVLLLHTDGNVSLLDVNLCRVVGYGRLRGAKALSSITAYCNRAGDEFSIAACDALYPGAWVIQGQVATDASQYPPLVDHAEAKFRKDIRGSSKSPRGTPRGGGFVNSPAPITPRRVVTPRK